MTEYPETIADRASLIAREVCGGVPATCTGWKAKIYNVTWEAAARASLPSPTDVVVDAKGSSIGLARTCAERVLMARLTKTPVEKRTPLLQRIAQIRGGAGDTYPEVQAAFIAAEELGRAAR